MFCYSVINLGNHFFLPIKSELIEGFWCSRCLKNNIDLSNMIGIFTSSATASLVAKIGTKIFFIQILGFSIIILCYLQAEIDYRPFMLFYRVLSYNYAQKNSGQSKKSWGCGVHFCHGSNISVGLTLEGKVPRCARNTLALCRRKNLLLFHNLGV